MVDREMTADSNVVKLSREIKDEQLGSPASEATNTDCEVRR
jgi:hypothetical protein